MAAHEAPAGGAGGKKRRPAAKRGGARRAPAAAAAPVSPERSASSSVTESSVTEQGNTGSSPGFPKEESFTSCPDAEEQFRFDESFWSETLSMPLESFDVPMEPCDAFGAAATSASAAAPDDMDYWLRVFMESGDVQQELPQI